jgi:mannose-6-phosphate isomerase-like protein (cupin superfamily)
MLRRLLVLIAVFAAAGISFSQTYGTGVDPYFGDWHTAPVHTLYGSLRAQDVLTAGDVHKPARKGAVLGVVKSFRHATLPANATTTAIHVSGVQQIYFVDSGSGNAKPANGASVALTPGCALLVPDGLTLTLHNSGTKPLSFYIIEEPVAAGFQPKKELVLRDANQLPFSTNHEQWSYLVKPVLTAADGLATLSSISIVEMSALTIGRPKLTPPGSEIVWTTLTGAPLAFVGNVLRHQPPGTAFMEIPDGKTPHSAVDPDQNTPVTFLVFEHGAK